MEEIRIQKYLAENGIASRRKCEKYILEGKVQVNGITITQLGTKINPTKDKISFDGKEIKEESINKVYILLNKPIGYVTTVKDQFHRNTVLDLVNIHNIRLIPVGRLDMYTSGALILTNDGDFIYKITHPKHEIEKTYIVTVNGKVAEEEIQKLREGINIENYTTSPASARQLAYLEEKNISRIEIIIHEGKNRQVRKMCEAIGKKVLALHRSKIGDLEVKSLKIGQWRYLTKSEVKDLINKNCDFY